MHSQLHIDTLRVPVHIGATAEEQQLAQSIELSISLSFSELPKACHSDQLQDTVAYDALCVTIKQFCAAHRFALIEAFGHALYNHIRNWLPAQHGCQRLWLSVRKQPPLSDVDSCTFALGDGHPHTWSS